MEYFNTDAQIFKHQIEDLFLPQNIILIKFY